MKARPGIRPRCQSEAELSLSSQSRPPVTELMASFPRGPGCEASPILPLLHLAHLSMSRAQKFPSHPASCATELASLAPLPTLEKKLGGSTRDASLGTVKGSGARTQAIRTLTVERGQNKPKSKRLSPLLLTKPLTPTHGEPDQNDPGSHAPDADQMQWRAGSQVGPRPRKWVCFSGGPWTEGTCGHRGDLATTLCSLTLKAGDSASPLSAPLLVRPRHFASGGLTKASLSLWAFPPRLRWQWLSARQG